jgi:adenosylcobinamide kinase/adenosylcobinamide-phosphate guanylyltransferase
MKTLLVLGGARSGKSGYAQGRCEALPGRLAYIATAQALDAEMTDRIARHQDERGERWHTVEASIDLPAAIAQTAVQIDGQGDGQVGAILVDCLTLWLTNLMLGDHDIAAASDALVRAVADCPRPLALVANEVGLGIVPDNALARRFRDEAGWLNRRMAQACREVVFVAAGLPLTMKAP